MKKIILIFCTFFVTSLFIAITVRADSKEYTDEEIQEIKDGRDYCADVLSTDCHKFYQKIKIIEAKAKAQQTFVNNFNAPVGTVTQRTDISEE